MKVLLLNGSPHEHGCVERSLKEVAVGLTSEGVEPEIFWIGNGAIRGCVACFGCRKPDAKGCVFRDAIYDRFMEKMAESDGIVIGAPVYYAGPAGSVCAFLDRVFFSASSVLAGKVGACVVNCRRGGASASFDRLNKYFTIAQMPVISSTYWNSTHGMSVEQVEQDLEGLRTSRVLGRNMAYWMKSRAEAKLPVPVLEAPVQTNFIR